VGEAKVPRITWCINPRTRPQPRNIGGASTVTSSKSRKRFPVWGIVHMNNAGRSERLCSSAVKHSSGKSRKTGRIVARKAVKPLGDSFAMHCVWSWGFRSVRTIRFSEDLIEVYGSAGWAKMHPKTCAPANSLTCFRQPATVGPCTNTARRHFLRCHPLQQDSARLFLSSSTNTLRKPKSPSLQSLAGPLSRFQTRYGEWRNGHPDNSPSCSRMSCLPIRSKR
jgi:hypothetical protein